MGYKGKTAGNLRQYIPLKPDEWGFKLFSRASEDRFIHDMILYQGLMEVTLEVHGIPISPEQETLTDTSQVSWLFGGNTTILSLSCHKVSAVLERDQEEGRGGLLKFH